MDKQQTVIRMRTFQSDDYPSLVEVINRAVRFDQEDQYTTLDDLRNRFERPYFYPEANCLIATLDGQITGCITAELDPRVGLGWGSGHVDPAFRRQGIGRALLRAADGRHRQRAASEVSPDLPLIVTRYCRDTNVGACTLLESEGYQIVRVTWFMQIDLPGEVEVPPLPTGVTLRPFDCERDAWAVYQAEQEMFRNNWGMVSPPYEVWQSIMLDERHQDALWVIAVAGEGGADDPVIGLCLSRPMGEDQPDTGYIDSLAVRSDWRGRGLGSALLLRGFQTIRAHGFTRAQLSVDSENQTNAVTLYEKAGMHVNRRYLIYRKAVRGDASAIWK